MYMLKTRSLTCKPQDDGSVLIIIQNNNTNMVDECHANQGGIVVHDDVTKQPSAEVCEHLKTVRIPKLQLKIKSSTDDVIVL